MSHHFNPAEWYEDPDAVIELPYDVVEPGVGWMYEHGGDELVQVQDTYLDVEQYVSAEGKSHVQR